MSIERLPFEHRPRNSIANNLDRINELIDWVNLDTHLYASASGERVTVDDTSSLKGLTVHGRSVQDGTPTPDAPVPVQVVSGKNLLPLATQTVTNRGVTATVDNTGTVTISGTATGGNAALTIPAASDVPLANNIYYTAQRITVSGSLDGTFYVRGIDDANQTVHHLFNLASVTERTAIFTNNAIIQAIYIIIPENTTIDCILHVQVEQGSMATDYVPYGNIALVIDDTPTAINLQGNTLASLPNGTHDELHIDSAGRVWIEKRVGYVSTNDLSANVAGAAVLTNFVRIPCTGAIADNPAPTSTAAINLNGYCNVVPFTGAGYGNDTLHCYAHVTTFYMFVPVGDKSTWNTTTAAEWITEHGAYAYYTPAATNTIDLGYIDPPAIPSGSVVTISASLTPTFRLECWVDDGITDVIEDLKAYVDYRIGG